MRQLLIEVPRGNGREALALALEHGAIDAAQLSAQGPDGPLDLVIAHVTNTRVGPLIQRLEQLPSMRVAFAPQPVLAMTREAEPRTDVEHKSEVEVFLAGLQSIGSWRGFLGYAAASGVLVWIGLATETVFLLIAAMLIAPFAGPAMNAALASARGAPGLLGRSLLRYFASILVGALVAAVLSVIFGPSLATPLMRSVSRISHTSILLPIVAGAAGALTLVQSERSSLVSGAATGMLVAASLAPPAGLLGMGAAMGRWDLVASSVFLVLLQVAAINLAGATVFRLHGVNARRVRYEHGKSWVVPVAMIGSAAVALALLAFQLLSPEPAFERASRSEDARAQVSEAVAAIDDVKLVDANVRFTAPDIPGQDTLLCLVYVQRSTRSERPAAELRAQVAGDVREHIRRAVPGVTPLVDVTVLDDPGGGAGATVRLR